MLLRVDGPLDWSFFHFSLSVFLSFYWWNSIGRNILLLNDFRLFGLGSLSKFRLNTKCDIDLCWLIHFLALGLFFVEWSFRSLWPLEFSLEAKLMLRSPLAMNGIEDIFGDAVSLDSFSKNLFLFILFNLVCEHIVIFAFQDCLIVGLCFLALALEHIVAPFQNFAIRILQKFIHIACDERCWWSMSNQFDDGNQEESIFK